MLDDLTGWIEMHIEQARVLQDTGNRIGIVTAIAGYVHADVTVHGRGDHAGATPMDFRLDPGLPLAESILELERLARAAGKGTVGTVGEIEVHPSLINAIPERIRFSLDIRGVDEEAYRRRRPRASPPSCEQAAEATRDDGRGTRAPDARADAARRADRRGARGGRAARRASPSC